jgi:hypothetical protein
MRNDLGGCPLSLLVMDGPPTENGFSFRLVKIGAGGSTPGDWSEGKVHWIAVSD